MRDCQGKKERIGMNQKLLRRRLLSLCAVFVSLLVFSSIGMAAQMVRETVPLERAAVAVQGPDRTHARARERGDLPSFLRRIPLQLRDRPAGGGTIRGQLESVRGEEKGQVAGLSQARQMSACGMARRTIGRLSLCRRIWLSASQATRASSGWRGFLTTPACMPQRR